jgi:hypothetical protein
MDSDEVRIESDLKACSLQYSIERASLAQQVERTAFNRVVVGSIPTGGETT